MSYYIAIGHKLVLWNCDNVWSATGQRCPNAWYQEGDKCYWFSGVQKTFDDAQAFCAEREGRVVVIADNNELDTLKRLRNENGEKWETLSPGSIKFKSNISACITGSCKSRFWYTIRFCFSFVAVMSCEKLRCYIILHLNFIVCTCSWLLCMCSHRSIHLPFSFYRIHRLCLLGRLTSWRCCFTLFGHGFKTARIHNRQGSMQHETRLHLWK